VAGRGTGTVEAGGVGWAVTVRHGMKTGALESVQGGRKNGPDPRAHHQFPFIPKFSTASKLKWSKEGLCELKNSQIKYEFEGFE
jgi:hypothetical protein